MKIINYSGLIGSIVFYGRSLIVIVTETDSVFTPMSTKFAVK